MALGTWFDSFTGSMNWNTGFFNPIRNRGKKRKKVNFRPVNTGWGGHLPFGRLIFRCMALAIHLHNEPVTFPPLPVPIYTPGSRVVKCLTQGRNGVRTHNLLFKKPTLVRYFRPHAPTNWPHHKHEDITVKPANRNEITEELVWNLVL